MFPNFLAFLYAALRFLFTQPESHPKRLRRVSWAGFSHEVYRITGQPRWISGITLPHVQICPRDFNAQGRDFTFAPALALPQKALLIQASGGLMMKAIIRTTKTKPKARIGILH